MLAAITPEGQRGSRDSLPPSRHVANTVSRLDQPSTIPSRVDPRSRGITHVERELSVSTDSSSRAGVGLGAIHGLQLGLDVAEPDQVRVRIVSRERTLGRAQFAM